MSELDFILDAKALADDGEIEGLAAGYGNLDFGGDVILPGAIAASIAGRKSVPMPSPLARWSTGTAPRNWPRRPPVATPNLALPWQRPQPLPARSKSGCRVSDQWPM